MAKRSEGSRAGLWILAGLVLFSGLGGVWGVSPARAEWGMSVFGGVTTGGTLYTAKNGGDTRSWEIPAGGTSYEGAEVRTDLGEFANVGLRVIGEFGERWGTHLSFSLSDLDVRALVRSEANNLSELDWDQIFVLNLEAVATFDLIPQGNTPYLLAGVGLSNLSSEGGELGQTLPAVVWGGGYKIRAIEGIQLDLDARDVLVFPSYDDEASRLAALEFSDGGALHMWEITLGWTYMFR